MVSNMGLSELGVVGYGWGLSRLGHLLHVRRFWMVTMAAFLVGLAVVMLLGSRASEQDAAEARQAGLLNAAYQQAATGVSAEESLERKYLLDSGPVPLAGYRAAQQQVEQAIVQISQLGSSSDRLLAAHVFAEHTDYVRGATGLFAAVDAHEPTGAINAIDTGQVDPIFTAIQSQVDTAAASHRSRAMDEVNTVRSASERAFVLDLATLLASIALIGSASVSLVRSRRRLQAQSDLNLHQALHDDLTGLPNRVLFRDRVDHALKTAVRADTQVAVMVVDLDRFKDVNDTLGHQYGDELLKHVGQRFSATLRASDSVARLGGDEFGILLCDTTDNNAVTAAERLTEALREPFTISGISLDVEASIGVVVAVPDTDVDVVLRHADVAMYEAKSVHLPFTRYEIDRDDNTIARLQLLGDLRRAIGNGELVLHYQPKVSATTGELHSVEALVRWQHPTRGLLLPDTFIPIAESTAVIHPLTTEILRQALSQVRSWLEHGWNIPVAVNISARSLLDLTFPAQVQLQLDAIDVPASLLSFELTESAIMTDPPRALTVLQALNAMGVYLSIDDFGTGYSSMSYLKSLPVRELKIDRTFIIGMATDNSDGVLAQSAIDLGHNLGLHVVAEGVEDAPTQQALSTMGCDLVQGYHICRPIPPTELDSWLRTHITTDPLSTNRAPTN
jgi:diguanylate cyclase (GGDEF)-like protein